MSDDRKVLLRRFLEDVWNEGRIDACDLYIADTYSIRHDPGDPWDGQTLDLAGFKNRLRLSRAPFPDQRFEVQEMIADGDAVAITWRWTATHLGDFPGFPATGTPIRMSGMTVYHFNGADRLTGHWQIADRLGVYQQLQQARAS
jgi:steroid delta-isomerase-like uncharacterized protein